MAEVTSPIMLDTTGQAIKQELAGIKNKIGATTALDVSYDNTYSGLTATDMQHAIDEVINSLIVKNTFTATISVSYNSYNTQGTMVDIPITIPQGYKILTYDVGLENYTDWVLLTNRGIIQSGADYIYRGYLKNRFSSALQVPVFVNVIFIKDI